METLARTDLIGKLPEEGQAYPLALIEQFVSPTPKSSPDIGVNFLPSALLTEQERAEKMGVVDARSIEGQEAYIQAASQTILTITDMDAGIGSSLPREEYIKTVAGRSEGSKGTDVHIADAHLPRAMSIAEIKAHRYHLLAARFKQTILEPMLNFESEKAYAHFLGLPVPTLRRKEPVTYKEFLNGSRIELANPIMQPHLPTIDVAANALSEKRMAPGGHGYLATLLLERLAHNPPGDNAHHVRSITNGDGVNNVASPEMVGFAVKERAGIVMVTTTRTQADVKGGILGLSRDEHGQEYTNILELEQARQAGQESLFQAVGLIEHPQFSQLGREHHIGQQYFNTNMTLLNERLLGEFLFELRGMINDDAAFARIITPDLIPNLKEQDGKNYIQLEGAMGSVLLKLNHYVTTDPDAKRLWAKVSGGSQFLRIINLDEDVRDDYFTSIKDSWNAFLQAESDRWTLNTDTWRLENQRKGHVISINSELLKSGFYKHLHNMTAAFRGTSVVDLDSLNILGSPVLLPGIVLKGNISITNLFGDTVDLSGAFKPSPGDDQVHLENVSIVIDEHGLITTSPLEAN